LIPIGSVETVLSRLGETPKPRTVPLRPALPDDVLRNYRYLQCISNSQLMDVWKAQAPDGVKKRVKLIYGLGVAGVPKVNEVLVRLQNTHHPGVLTPQVVHVGPGRLVLQTDYVRETVRSRAHQCQLRKQPGIPRAELIDYIRAAAEVLDYL